MAAVANLTLNELREADTSPVLRAIKIGDESDVAV
jgi:hypothetical protein